MDTKLAIYDPTPGGLAKGAKPYITDEQYLDASSAITTSIENYNEIVQRFDELENFLISDDLTSLGAYLKTLGTRTATALSGIDDLASSQDKYNSIAKAVQAYFTKDFLQESGRTISNIDRELINQIMPQIGLNSIGISQDLLLEKLRNAKEQITQKLDEKGSRLNALGIYNPKMAQQFILSQQEEIELDKLRKQQDF